MLMFLDLVIFLVAIGVLISHNWAMRSHFVGNSHFFQMRFHIFLFLFNMSILTMVGLSRPSHVWAEMIGLGAMLLCNVLFWWAIKETAHAKLASYFNDDRTPHCLIQTGPFALIRHPFYASYILFWMGWSIAVWHPASLIPAITMLVYYIKAIKDDEADFYNSSFSNDYENYASRTGAIFPKIFKFNKTASSSLKPMQ